MKITPTKMFRKIKDIVKKPLSFIKDIRSESFLKKLAGRNIGESGIIKVAFLVFEPETWEQQECVYKELVKNSAFKVDVIVIPNFDRNFKVEKIYGDEKDFFQKRCGDIILAYDENGRLYDLKKARYDYIFYEDQYNIHYPKEYNTYRVCRYSRICCIPYGFTQGETFLRGYTKDFFRGVYCVFAPCEYAKNYLVKLFSEGNKKGYRHYETLGYPILDKYLSLKDVPIKDKILWTPRWSYDKKVGGSHFLEFKDGFKNLNQKYPKTEIVFRPHPMMFTEFTQKGYMSESEIKSYLTEIKKNGIIKSENASVYEDFKDAEILITDFSSIILLFFLSGRPIIYSPLDTKFNEDYALIINASYTANTWEEVELYLKEIKSGNDYLKTERERVIDYFFEKHHKSTERIVNYLISKK